MRTLLIFLATVALAAAFWFGFLRPDVAEPTDTSTDSAEAPVEPEQARAVSGYRDYSLSALAASRETKQVLFFHASWCPTCKVLNENLRASDVPENVTILKVDYDNSSDLKKKYGVTYQHTLVHIDDQGELISKWNGSFTLEEILANL